MNPIGPTRTTFERDDEPDALETRAFVTPANSGEGSAAPSSGALQFTTSPESRDLSGTRLGDYTFDRLLGRGGMGEVYLGTQLSLKRAVALKVLRQDLSTKEVNRRRFKTEALAAAKLNHPHVVQIYAIEEIQNTPFLVMEYVPGFSLGEYLRKKGPPDLASSLAIMRQASKAVAAAGERGLVHRDLKPENLLFSRKGGAVKVADFGLARIQDDTEDADRNTQEGVTVGTPMYMSPEQVQNHTLDHRSDLYSLGVTFYHLLSGAPPFKAETAVALALKHVRDRPVNLAVHRPDLPPRLVEVVMKLLEKDPARRFASAHELDKVLAEIQAGLNAASPGPAGPVATSGPAEGLGANLALTAVSGDLAPASDADAQRPGRPWKWPSVPKAGLVVAALALGLVVGIGLRAPNLLSARSGAEAGFPGNWMADWRVIGQKPTAEAQYRHAQFEVAPTDQIAAWLAVPGYHPALGESKWAVKASTQLARHLFRTGDTARLAVYADELDRQSQRANEAGRSGATESAKQLAQLCRAASLLKDEPDTAFRLLQTLKEQTTDSGTVLFALEVVQRLDAGANPTLRNQVRQLRAEFRRLLNLQSLELFETLSNG